jgi:2-polyprenyl-3-methyl-5-hydroxy-6-metoxy-1,4-benzoquinol methylase
MKVKDHYDKHLGNFYSWMVGDFDAKQLEQEVFFRHQGIAPIKTRIAFDLGAGHGLQAVSLANLGFSVKAVDFNEQLLAELSNNRRKRAIEIIHADILDFLNRQSSNVDTIVCMGDTITHLPDINDAEKLIRLCSKLLVKKGKLVFSFRDFSIALKKEERFIPVKQDNERILTCFLEYFPDHVMVHDILHEKHDAQWIQKISSYPKLRLNSQIIENLFNENGFKTIFSDTVNRMIYMIGEKV